ncbi:MAG: cytochrome c oxidase subunit II [Pirellulaceae bacterium]
MDTSFRLFPEQASTAAEQVDRLYVFLLGVASFFTVLILVLIVYFVLKYRHGARVDRSQVSGNRYWILEITWSLIPLGLTMIMFGWGADLFFKVHHPPSGCIEINVLAKQWMWKIQHADGKQEINSLHVPVGTPVKLRMISEDVIHSFFVPNFRVKQDVLPGRYTTIWFQPTKTGRYHLFCAEYCGTSHSRMTGEIVVQEPTDYADWLQGGASECPETAGRKLYDQFRCTTCHASLTNPRCPPLDGIFGRTVRLNDGSTLVADEAYLRESILNPTAQVVAGYKPVMPTYKGQIGEEGIFQLIAYLKSLKSSQQALPLGDVSSPETSNSTDQQP